MRALASHPSSNPKLLPFNRGELVTVLGQEPRNGWLFGRTDSSLRCVSWQAEMSAAWLRFYLFFLFLLFFFFFFYSSSQGWFPAAYVGPIEDFSNTIATRYP